MTSTHSEVRSIPTFASANFIISSDSEEGSLEEHLHFQTPLHCASIPLSESSTPAMSTDVLSNPSRIHLSPFRSPLSMSIFGALPSPVFSLPSPSFRFMSTSAEHPVIESLSITPAALMLAQSFDSHRSININTENPAMTLEDDDIQGVIGIKRERGSEIGIFRSLEDVNSPKSSSQKNNMQVSTESETEVESTSELEDEPEEDDDDATVDLDVELLNRASKSSRLQRNPSASDDSIHLVSKRMKAEESASSQSVIRRINTLPLAQFLTKGKRVLKPANKTDTACLIPGSLVEVFIDGKKMSVSIEDRVNMKGTGSSCHQCKSRREFHLLSFCSRMFMRNSDNEKRQLCRRKYCDACLAKFYHEQSPHIRHHISSGWLCPACRHGCCCAACRRAKKAKHEAFAYSLFGDDFSILTMPPETSLAVGLVHYREMLDPTNNLSVGEILPSIFQFLYKELEEKSAAYQALAKSKEAKDLSGSLSSPGPLQESILSALSCSSPNSPSSDTD